MSETHWTFEVVLVPISEELVFRGLLLGGLLAALRRRRPEATAIRLAVIYSAVAFGLAHAANALEIEPAFVAFQVVIATLMGLLFGAMRMKTDSIYPAILLHAVINGVNLLA